jgi:hypothetical protein
MNLSGIARRPLFCSVCTRLDSKEANYSGDSGEQSRRSQESGNRDRDRPDRRSGRGFLAGVGIWGLYCTDCRCWLRDSFILC